MKFLVILLCILLLGTFMKADSSSGVKITSGNPISLIGDGEIVDAPVYESQLPDNW